MARKIIGSLGQVMNNSELKAIQDLLDGLSLESRADYFAGSKTKDQINAYKQMVKTGHDIHNLRRSLGAYAKAAADLGFPNAQVIETGEIGADGTQTFRIIFYPTAMENGMTDNDCPQLTISTRNGLGVGVDNHVPSMERLIAVRSAGNEVGLASAMAVGIDDAVRKLTSLAHSARFAKATTTRQKARLVKSTTSNAIRDVTRANPMIHSGRAANEHQSAFNISDQRVESIAAVAGQVDWSYLFSTLYNHRSGVAKADRNAPRSATEFNRLINKMFQDARGAQSFDKFENVIKSKPEYKYIYDNFWKNGLQSAFSQIFDIGLVQGTKTEGAPDLTSFFDVEIPGMPLVEKSSRKPAQNMRVRPPRVIPGRSTNITHTAAQKAFAGTGGHPTGGNLYTGGYISDKDLTAAYERFVKEQLGLTGKDAYDMKHKKLRDLFKKNPFLGDFRRGINLDASIYDAELINDFREEYSRTIEVSQRDFDREVAKIKDSMTKRGKSFTEDQIRRKAFSSLAGLRPSESLGKIFDDFATDGTATITTKGILKNPTFKGLGAGTSDFRSVLAPTMSKLLGYAFEHAGYQASDIYNPDGTLKMQFARQTEGKLEPKRFFNQAMGMYYYMVDQMQKSGKSLPEIEEIINSGLGVGKTSKGARRPGRLLTAEADGLLFNNQSKVFKDPVALLEGLARIGQEQGLYAKSQGGYTGNIFERTTFTDEDGKLQTGLIQRILTPIATEIGRTTILPWEGTQSDSRLHYGYREMHSFQNTLGLMRAMGMDTAGGQNEISALLGGILEANEDPRYKAYRKNISDIRKYTFNPDSAGSLAQFQKDALGLVLSFDNDKDMDEIFSKISDEEILYNKDGTVVADDAYLHSPAYLIAERKRKHYEALVKKYGADYLATKGITSAEAVPTAIDMGAHTITHGGMAGNLVVLPSGIAGTPDEYGSAEYDQLSGLTSRMVRGLMGVKAALPSDASAAALGGKIIAEAQQEAAEAILHKEGSIYQRFKQVEVGDSAYFMTQGLSSELFNPESAAYDPERYHGNVVMNSQDYIDLLLRDNTEENAADLQNKLYAKYQGLAGSDLREHLAGNERFGALSVQQQNREIARAIARLANINDKRFRGAVTGSLFNRFPTIRGTNDILSTGVILDDNFVKRGNIAVDPFLSLEAKQDNDADRIGLTSGLSYQKGLTQEQYLAIEQEAARRKAYFDALVEKQRALGAKKFTTVQEEVALDDLRKLADPAHQLAQAQLVNSGKSLTGLYGDLLDGVNEALYAAGLTNASISGKNDIQGIETGLQSQMLGNLLATAHQEAISSKKIEEDAKAAGVEDFDALSVEDQAKYIIKRWDKLRSFNDLMRTGSTYASRSSMGAMIDEGIKKGIFDGEGNLFKSNVLAGVMPTSRAGLNFLARLKGIDASGKSDDDLLSMLLKSGISKENFLDMIYGNTALGIEGLQSKIKSDRQGVLQGKGVYNLGDIVNSIYRFIPGKGIGGKYAGEGGIPDAAMAERLRAIGVSIPGMTAGGSGGEAAPATLFDWAKTPGASWGSMYQNALKSYSNTVGYGSPHKLQDVFADQFGPNITPIVEQVMTKLMSGADASLEDLLKEDFFKENEGLLKSLNLEGSPDVVRMLNSTLRGQLIHSAAEYLGNVFTAATERGWDESAIRAELEKGFKKDPNIQRDQKRLARFLQASGLSNEQIALELSNVRARAMAQTSVFGSIKPENMIGSEAVLWGQHGKLSTTGIADLLYKETLEDGTNAVRVLDYKNTAGGKLGARDLMQVLHYIQDLKTLQQDINEHGTMSTQDYIFGSSPIATRFQESFKYMAGEEAKRAKEAGEEFDEKAFIAHQNEILTRLIDALRGDTKILGRVQYTDQAGTLRQYDLDPEHSTVLRGLINKYNNQGVITKEDTDLALSQGKEIYRGKVEGFVSTANTEALQEYVRLLKEQLELENQIAVLEEKQRLLRERGKTEEANELDKEINTLKERLEGTSDVAKKKEIETKLESLRTQEKAARENGKKSEADKLNQEILILEQRLHGTKGLVAAAGDHLKESNATEFGKSAASEILLGEQQSLIESVKTVMATALASATEEMLNDFRKSDEAEMLKTYKSGMPEYTKATLRKREIERILGDGTSLETPGEKRELRRELEGLNAILDPSEKSSLAHVLESIKAYFDSAAASGKGKDDFGKMSKDLLADFDDAVHHDEAFGEGEYKRAKYRKGRQQYNEVYSAVNGVSNAQYRVWEMDQRISRESNEKVRSYLVSEREALAELVKDAETRVDALKAAHTGKGGKLDPRYEALFADVGRRVGLESSAKRDAYEARMAGGANGGGGFGLSNQLSLYFKRMLGGGLLMRALGKLRQEIQKVVTQAKELDKVMTNVRIVTNGTIESTRNLMSEYSKLGKELGVTTKEVAQSGIEWMRQGYEAAEATKLITASLYLSKLGMIDSTTATKSLTSALKGFKLEASEAMGVVDKLTAIDLKAATSAGDIAEGLAQFANLGSLSGVDIDQAAAYVATIADVTQKSGSSAGQALKTIISRYGNVKAGAYNKLNVDSENSDTAESLNDVEKVLSKIGISIRETNLQFKDFDEVLAEIAEKWNSLDNVSKKAIANAFAGVRQQESFVTLLENWGKYEELLETSRTSEGTAETKYQSYKESLEASTNRLQATIEDFVNKAEISNLLKVLTDIATSLAQTVPWLIRWVPQIFAAIQNLKIFSGNSMVQKLFKNEKVMGWAKQIGANFSGSIADLEETGTKHAGIKGFFRGLRKTLLGGETRTEAKTRTDATAKRRLADERRITLESDKRVKFAKLESKYKNDVKTQAVLERLKKGEVLSDADQEVLKSKTKLSNATLEALVSSGSLTKEQAIELYRAKGLSNAKEEAKFGQLELQYKERVAATGATETSGGGGGSPAPSSGGKGGKPAKVGKGGGGGGGAAVASGLAAAASYIMNQAIAAVSAWNTAGTTHKYVTASGETREVSSSKAAHERGRAIVTGFTAAIPFIGSMIGEAVADKVMRDIDKARDDANYASEVANKKLDALNGLQNDFNNIKNLTGATSAADIATRNASVENYLNSLYSSDNAELREMLQNYLSGISEDLGIANNQGLTLNNLMEQYQHGDTKTKDRIVKALEIAQKKAERAQQQEARAAEQYAYQERIGEKRRNFNAGKTGYTSRGITNEQEAAANAAGAGAGIGTGVGVAAGTMGAFALGALAVGASVPVVGWIVGGVVAAIAGLFAGIFAGIAAAEAKRAEAEAQQMWDNKLLSDKIKSLNETEISIREKIDEKTEELKDAEGDNAKKLQKEINSLSDDLAKTEEYNKALKDYAAWIAQQNAKENKLVLEEGLLSAGVKNETTGKVEDYLMDMSVGQLRTLGAEEIYKMLADVVQNKVLGMNVYDENGELTEEFIRMATEVLKEDDDIAQRLTGETLTLREALATLNPNDRFDAAILQNFATALHVNVEDLTNLSEAFGNLTLAEMLMSTTELNESIKTYGDLVSSITDSNQSVSEWMNTIIKQFPDLIQYMGDVPSLMTAIVEKVHELSDRYIQSQWDEYASSKEFFETVIKPDILNQFEGEDRTAIEDVLNRSGAYDMNSLRTFLNGADENDPLMQKLSQAFANAGANQNIVSDVYKDFLKQYIDYNVSLMDKQLENLTAQRDMLQQINQQREYENKLMEARNKLDDAQNEKRRIYRAGVGWVYEADQEKIKEAQENLEEVEGEKDISAITKQIELLTATKDEWSNVWEKENFELAKQQAEAFAAEFGIDGEGGTLNEQLNEITKDGGLLDGIKQSVSSLTSAILDQDKREVDKILNGDKSEGASETEAKSLTDLWNDYVQSIGTNNENDALAAFTSRYNAAKAAGIDMSAWEQSLGDAAASTKGSATAIGESGYDANKVTPPKFFDVEGGGFKGSLASDGEEISSKDAGFIWGDMKTSAGGGKSADAARMWDVSDGKVVGSGKNFSEVDGRLKPYSSDENLYEYAARTESFKPEMVIAGLDGDIEWAYLKNGKVYKMSTDKVRIYEGGKSKLYTDSQQYGDYVNNPVLKDIYLNSSNKWADSDGNALDLDIQGKQGRLSRKDVKKLYDAGYLKYYRRGTLGAGSNGLSLINEAGPEGLVTPDGTLTTLPAHTGVLPADITKNLWELGSVAPSILRALQMSILPDVVTSGRDISSMIDESLTVNNLTMNVKPDGTFDARKFVQSLKEQAALTRNLKK